MAAWQIKVATVSLKCFRLSSGLNQLADRAALDYEDADEKNRAKALVGAALPPDSGRRAN
jgi:hypothetical protein